MQLTTWYQVNSDDIKSDSRLNELKELGINGLYVDFKIDDAIKDKLEKLGFQLENTSDSKVLDLINAHMVNHEMNTEVFIEKLKANLDSDKLINLAGIDNNQSLYQALAFLTLTTSNPVIPHDLLSEKDSQNWNKTKQLIELRNKFASLLQDSPKKITETESGLIEVRRLGSQTLTGFFNTSQDALGFNSVANIIQNYLVGQLLPKGVVIKED